MIAIGNFFFKYRNFLFIFLYLALFIPSPQIFKESTLGKNYYLYPLIIGLFITIVGQLIRGVAIALAYIVRGGKDKNVYADHLVIEGFFNHCRNPLYVGNVLMLVGVGILINSLLFMVIFIPLFLFIYQAIVLAEENFLRNKFGEQFDAYCTRVNRWWINFSGLTKTINNMAFNGKRWLIKEYNTQTVWLAGIIVILLFYYPQLTQGDEELRNKIGIATAIVLAIYYLTIRYLKKSGTWKG
ncbi:isoprenylcysteine carboxylmethyltransferase family protein [Pedobacter sp. LMG 31464]|uniref:Isoprenylcysteine carboxylmethyltransferase family protein n=1 Tax=Pedobacter planticolens TaxID=2679964 RepID=A0A923IVE9_9SPHI|nr:isoprenylcysteine carboxylmethyltransferase family protein [Pedobacter planticolens]MBB2145109.1 isoprenylcysteine carboxylmethyltransferase family protein [Pedobacter planticolens]